MAKLHIKSPMVFASQALRSGLAVPLQSIQHAARLQITAAVAGSSSEAICSVSFKTSLAAAT